MKRDVLHDDAGELKRIGRNGRGVGPDGEAIESESRAAGIRRGVLDAPISIIGEQAGDLSAASAPFDRKFQAIRRVILETRRVGSAASATQGGKHGAGAHQIYVWRIRAFHDLDRIVDREPFAEVLVEQVTGDIRAGRPAAGSG